MDDKIELIDCPFCGSDDVRPTGMGVTKRFAKCYNLDCGAEATIDTWQKRANRTDDAAQKREIDFYKLKEALEVAVHDTDMKRNRYKIWAGLNEQLDAVKELMERG